jgi:phage baseplate assembly protein W
MNIAFPYRIDGHGRTAAVPQDDHIRDLIEQLLFTNPGERVNRPSFGSGLLQMVFEPHSTELAAALQFTLQASLQNLLGSLIQLQTVQVAVEDSILHLTVEYIVRADRQTQSATFSREI